MNAKQTETKSERVRVNVFTGYLYNVRVLFRFQRLQFVFTAEQRLQFAGPVPGNMLRGALGYALKPFPVRYERVFAPKRAGGPSGLTNAARPFVFRAANLAGAVVDAGAEFRFEMNVFDPAVVQWLVEAFEVVAKDGLGPRRSPLNLQHFEEQTCEMELTPSGEAVERVRVQFVTPTELKVRGAIADEPDFAILTARLRDRVSELCTLYGDGPLAIDFVQFAERAAAVNLHYYEIKSAEMRRFSSRTGQSHSLGGFLGWAEYQGALGEFMPLLRAARFTGVGRHTTWGKGEIQVPVRFSV